MARVIVEDAVIATGRTPETIERWILAGRIDAERAGDDWLIDLSSLLNVAAVEEMGGNGQTHHPEDVRSPIGADADVSGGRRGPIQSAVESAVIRLPSGSETMEAAASETTAVAASETLAQTVTSTTTGFGEASTPADGAPLAPLARTEASSSGTVEIAATAIAALSARLEQALGEIERMHDERMKMALQLGYAQAQLKVANEQLRALSAPIPEPPSLVERIRKFFRGR